MPPRVLFITTSFPIGKDSNSGIFVYRLVKALTKQVPVTVLTPDDCSPRETVHADAGYTLKTFRYAPLKWQLLAHRPGGIPVALAEQKLLYFLLPVFLLSLFFSACRNARQADIIHANWTVTGFIAGLAGLVWRKPVITTVRGADIERLEKAITDRFVTWLCLGLNSRIACVSPGLKKKLAALYPRFKNRLLFIPNGVDQELLDIRREPRPAHGDEIRLITVGSLIPRKSVETIIRALPACPGCTLAVLGEGPMQSRLEKLAAEMQLDKRISFRGAIAPDAVGREMANADILVIASRSEGRPNVVLEALAAGLPVIASRIDGITDFIHDDSNGLLFTPGDPDSLAACIRRLGDDPGLRDKLSGNGRRYILENRLTWESCAGNYADIYRQLVHDRTR